MKKTSMAIKQLQSAIFETATRLFEENGIKAVTMDKIASECGVPKITVYRNFISKDELILSYLALCRRDLVADMDAAINGRNKSQADGVKQALIALVNNRTDGIGAAYRLAGFWNEYAYEDHPGHTIVFATLSDIKIRISRALAANGAAIDALMMLLRGALRANYQGQPDQSQDLQNFAWAIDLCLNEPDIVPTKKAMTPNVANLAA
jgi:AcrR family transcriptional regulator